MNTISSLLKFLGNTLGANPTTTLTTTSKTLVGAINEVASASDTVLTHGQEQVTEGGTGYWRWREWKSGKVEMWYHGAITLEAVGSSGGVYRASKRISFPNGYALRKCACIVDGTIQGGWLNCGGIFNSDNSDTEPHAKVEVMAYRISSAPELNQTNVNIYACGERNNA